MMTIVIQIIVDGTWVIVVYVPMVVVMICWETTNETIFVSQICATGITVIEPIARLGALRRCLATTIVLLRATQKIAAVTMVTAPQNHVVRVVFLI